MKYICLYHLKKEVEMILMPRQFMEHKNIFKGRLFAFFTVDSKFVGIKTNGGNFNLYRVENGKLMCSLNFEYIDFAMTLGRGGFMQAMGIIDVKSRNCSPWTLEALVHFSRDDLHLFSSYVLEDRKKWQMDRNMVLGGPMPALFPAMFSKFMDNSTWETRKQMVPMLLKYTVFPQFYNLIHWLAKRNMPNLLSLCFEKERTRWFAVNENPILNSTMRCGQACVNYATRHQDIAAEFSHEVLLKILQFPDEAAKSFFD